MFNFEKVSFEQFKADVNLSTFQPDSLEQVYKDIILPYRSTQQSAGYDFFTPFNINLQPQEVVTIPTGIKAKLPSNSFLMMCPRSGQGFKYFLRLANTVGIIDADYYNNYNNEGHIFIKLRVEGDKPLSVPKNKSIAQGIILPFFTMSGDVSIGQRSGGFGSTD